MKFHTFYGHAAETGDLLLWKIVQAAHIEDTPSLRRQTRQRTVYDLMDLLRKKLFGVTGFKGRNTCILIPYDIRTHPIGNVCREFFTPNVVQTFVFDDSQDIGREILRGMDIGPVFPIINERINYQIFGRTPIPHIRHGKTYEPFLVFGEQVIKQIYV